MPKWNWNKIKSGKVRDIYECSDGKRIALVASDRVSAFDKVLPNGILGKGKILTKMSAFWFELTKDDAKNAFITTDMSGEPFFSRPEFEGRVTIMKKLRMLPIEAIVRGYITGSLWKSYQEGSREFCGLGLEDGLKNCQVFMDPLFTPTTKSEEGHDENISFVQMIDILEQEGYDSPDTLAEMVRAHSIALYSIGLQHALSRGIILADTKFEFGVDEDGALLVADELFTPDSSRFWPLDEYTPGRDQPSYDKQIIRDYVAEHSDATEVPQSVLYLALRQYERYLEALTRKPD